MSKYRILEKKGKYSCSEVHRLRCALSNPTHITSCYIPRFIVQEDNSTYSQQAQCKLREDGSEFMSYINISWKDLKEFTNLDEARAYKRELELEEGIVRE